MEKPSLKDEFEYPGDDVLRGLLGDAKPAWDAFVDSLKTDHPTFTGEWRYYNDGHNWLFKVAKKDKTITWVSVYPGKFKTTFYFGDKAEESIVKSGLRKEHIDQYLTGPRSGRIRAITVTVAAAADLKATKELMGIRERVK